MNTPSLPTQQVARLGGHGGGVHAVTYSAGFGQYVRTRSSPPIFPITLNSPPANLSRFPPQILTGSNDRQIRLFNPSHATTTAADSSSAPELQPIQTYAAHGHGVLDLAVSADNARIASVGGDKAVFLWDVARAVTLRRFTGHGGRVEACAFAGDAATPADGLDAHGGGSGGGGGAAWAGGDGSVVVSGSFDGTVRVWDCRSNAVRPVVTLSEARDGVSCVRTTRGAELLAGSTDGRVRTYDVRMGTLDTDVIGREFLAFVFGFVVVYLSRPGERKWRIW